MHWLSETLRKAPGNGANEPNLGAGTGLIAEQERGPSRSIGHFQQVRAVAPLTRRAESSLSDNLAPQVGFGPEYSIDNIGSCWFYCRSEERRVGKECRSR